MVEDRVEMALTMREFLAAVAQHGVVAREVLIDRGYHPKVILAKAEKAARKNYTDYGVVADRPWLTAEGVRFVTSDATSDDRNLGP